LPLMERSNLERRNDPAHDLDCNVSVR
jgi:hypothetical protein